MKELSIFVDESGDFGEYNRVSPFYIVTVVLIRWQITLFWIPVSISQLGNAPPKIIFRLLLISVELGK